MEVRLYRGTPRYRGGSPQVRSCTQWTPCLFVSPLIYKRKYVHMDQAIEVQNYAAVHSARGSSRYVPCSENVKSALSRTLLATAVTWKIHTVKF